MLLVAWLCIGSTFQAGVNKFTPAATQHTSEDTLPTTSIDERIR